MINNFELNVKKEDIDFLKDNYPDQFSDYYEEDDTIQDLPPELLYYLVVYKEFQKITTEVPVIEHSPEEVAETVVAYGHLGTISGTLYDYLDFLAISDDLTIWKINGYYFWSELLENNE